MACRSKDLPQCCRTGHTCSEWGGAVTVRLNLAALRNSFATVAASDLPRLNLTRRGFFATGGGAMATLALSARQKPKRASGVLPFEVQRSGDRIAFVVEGAERFVLDAAWFAATRSGQ